jgi:hypothetical protein
MQSDLRTTLDQIGASELWCSCYLFLPSVVFFSCFSGFGLVRVMFCSSWISAPDICGGGLESCRNPIVHHRVGRLGSVFVFPHSWSLILGLFMLVRGWCSFFVNPKGFGSISLKGLLVFLTCWTHPSIWLRLCLFLIQMS